MVFTHLQFLTTSATAADEFTAHCAAVLYCTYITGLNKSDKVHEGWNERLHLLPQTMVQLDKHVCFITDHVILMIYETNKFI